MPKREPTLADAFIHTPAHKMNHPVAGERRRIQLLQDKTRRAEKMIFGQEASVRVGMVLRDIPELVIEQLEFARAPYDLCWVEYDSNTIWEILSGRAPDNADMTRDKTVGTLIDHGTAHVISNSYDGDIGILPFVYHLNTEWPIADQIRFAEYFNISRAGIDEWLWGAVANNFRRTGRSDHLRALRDVTMVEYIGIKAAPHKLNPLVGYTRGDLKNIIALLLMLNQPSITRYAQVAPTRGWIGSSPHRYAAHHQVHVALDAHQQMVKFVSSGGNGELRRLHRVRGHYCHDETARDFARIAGCIHNWVATDAEWTPAPELPLDEREHWQCSVCDGKRWWRTEHERGSAEKGYVRHDEYRVTP